jgi:hypothetical protein
LLHGEWHVDAWIASGCQQQFYGIGILMLLNEIAYVGSPSHRYLWISLTKVRTFRKTCNDCLLKEAPTEWGTLHLKIGVTQTEGTGVSQTEGGGVTHTVFEAQSAGQKEGTVSPLNTAPCLTI